LPNSKGPPSSLVQLRSAVWTGDTRDTTPAADIACARRCLRTSRTLYLRVGPGCFAATVIAGQIRGSARRVIYARTRTFWTASDQMPLTGATLVDRTVACMLLDHRSRERGSNAPGAAASSCGGSQAASRASLMPPIVPGMADSRRDPIYFGA
jgi:hypothetical protein